MRASSVSSFLRAGPRRRATRSDLGRVRLQSGDLADQRVDRRGGVPHPGDLDHPLPWPSQGDEVELLSPIDANTQHGASFRSQRDGQRHGAGLMDQSSRDDTLAGVWPQEAIPQGRHLTSVLKGQGLAAFLGGGSYAQGW